MRGLASQFGIILVFTAPAVVLWWRAWSGGAASTIRCYCLDPGQQVWFVNWPAYSVLHGLDPFSTTWLWPSHGVNLLANASSPLVGLVLAPVTWVFGPFVATTVALTLAPGLTAWGCWLAARRFVSWSPACWIAGFLFGYSPFVVENVDQGHLGLALLVFPPLIVVLLHEILVRQRWRAAWCGIALGLLLFAQFMVSQEILTLTVLTAAVATIVCALLAPRRAATAFPFAFRAFAIGAVVAMVTLAWPVWYMLEGPQHIRGSVWAGLQVVFTSQAFQIWNVGDYALHQALFPAGAGFGPPVQFLGIAVLVVAGLALGMSWNKRAAWMFAVIAVLATFCSWGSAIYFSSTHVDYTKWLPWQWVTNWPLLNNIESVHFVAIVDLAVVIIIAMGTGAAHSWLVRTKVSFVLRLLDLIVLCAVVAAMVVPIWSAYRAPLVVQKVRLPPWYATVGLTVPKGSVIVSYPFPSSADYESQPMVWQVADGMRFRLAGGYVKVPGATHAQGVIGTGPRGSATWTLDALTLAYGQGNVPFNLTAGEIAQLRLALRQWDVSFIVVTNIGAAPAETAGVFTAVTGLVPRLSHRAWVWRIQPGAAVPANPTVAADAFESCRTRGTRLGSVPASRSLPQAFNRCVALHSSS